MLDRDNKEGAYAKLMPELATGNEKEQKFFAAALTEMKSWNSVTSDLVYIGFGRYVCIPKYDMF